MKITTRKQEDNKDKVAAEKRAYSNSVKVELDSTNISVDIRPESAPITCFGAPSSSEGGDTNKEDIFQDPNSAYGRLFRRPNLPEKCPYSCENKKAQDLAMKAWNKGDIHAVVSGGLKTNVEFSFKDGHKEVLVQIPGEQLPRNILNMPGQFSVTFSCTLDDDDEKESSSVELLSVEICGQGSVVQSTAKSATYKQTMGPALAAHLSFDFQEALTARLLHRLLRQHGQKLPWPAINGMFGPLDHFYRNRRSSVMVQKLDLYMIRTDLLFMDQELGGLARSQNLGLSMQEIAEILEALGRFEEAAGIYLELFEHYPVQKIDPNESKALNHTNAGLAFKRAQQYGKSFQAYVKALYYQDQFIQGNWDLSECSVILNNILVLHQEVHAKHICIQSQNIGYQAIPGEEKLMQAFGALLLLAGFLHTLNPGTIAFNFVSDCSKREVVSSLKRDYRRCKGARKQLKRLFETGDAATHFKILYSTFGDEAKYNPTKGLLSLNLQSVSKSDQKEAIQSAKERVAEITGREYSHCNNCGIKDEKGNRFLLCPCKAVYYCQKQCQTEDWKDHKTTCRWHAAKKAAK